MTDRNLMKFNEIKYKVNQHLRSNPRYQSRLGGSQDNRKALRNLIGTKLPISQQCTLIEKVTSILSCNRKNHTSRSRGDPSSLFSTGDTHLGC